MKSGLAIRLGNRDQRKIIYRPIGIIHSSVKRPEETPRQAAGCGIEGWIEIFPEYLKGLKDLEGFSHVFLIYCFHLCRDSSLRVKSCIDRKVHGIFATRSPERPNPIGLSLVRLGGVSGNVLRVRDLDVVEGTPLLDIKPFVPEIDSRKKVKIGWLLKRDADVRKRLPGKPA